MNKKITDLEAKKRDLQKLLKEAEETIQKEIARLQSEKDEFYLKNIDALLALIPEDHCYRPELEQTKKNGYWETDFDIEIKINRRI